LLPEKGQPMPQTPRGGRMPALVFAAALCVIACPAADAKESAASVNDAEQYIAAGDLKAAVIELKNAVLVSPQDPAIRARLAQVYLQLEDFRSAEREGARRTRA
jgi:Tfp pilus assembly protein PilF